MNQKLFDYIKKELARGTSKDEIVEALCANGWKEDIILDTYEKVSNAKKFNKIQDLDFGFDLVDKKRPSFWLIFLKFLVTIYTLSLSLFLLSGFVDICLFKDPAASNISSIVRIEMIICAIFAFSLIVCLLPIFGRKRHNFIYLALLMLVVAIEIQLYRLITVSSYSFSKTDVFNWIIYGIPCIVLLAINKTYHSNK